MGEDTENAAQYAEALPWLRRKLIGSALSKIKPEDFVDVWFGAM